MKKIKKLIILIMLCSAAFCNAATITSAASGEWNAGTTWVGGSVPVAGDAVVIASGHTVTHNYDGSAVEYSAIIINGTLELASSASSSLYTNSDMGGSGVLKCGTAASPLPASRTATIRFDGNVGVSGTSGLTVSLYCDEITIPVTTLTGAEGTGDAVITVDDDITAVYNDLSADGRTVQIRIDDISGTLPESTLESISSIDSTGKIITLTNNLDAEKSIGAKVVFITRNIRIVMNNASADCFTNVYDGVYGCEMSGTTTYDKAFSYSSGTVSGTISGCSGGLYYSSGTVSGVISGCLNGIIGLPGAVSGTISGCTNGIVNSLSTVSGTISGCQYGITNSNSTVSGTIAGCTYGLYYSSGTVSGTISGCSTGLCYSYIQGYGATLCNNSTANFGYSKLPPLQCTMIENYNGVTGNFWGWTTGGVITRDTATYPNGALEFPYVYLLDMGNTDNLCFKQATTVVDAHENLIVRGIIKISGNNSTYIPRLEIIDASDDVITGGTALAVDYLDSYDGSITDWQRVSVNYRNTTAAPKTVIIRLSCGTASQDVYCSWDYSTSKQWLGR